MMTADVTINRHGVERARGRHRWIYRSDLLDASRAEGGDLVRVTDSRGSLVGQALYSSRSQIALRLVCFDATPINREFWLSQLVQAEELRTRVVSDATAYRLVYGESDGLPSLIIDRFNDCFVIQTLSQGMEKLKRQWTELLVERYSPRAIVERNEVHVRDLEGLPRVAGLVYGSDPGEVVIEESGVRLAVDLIKGQKTGAFLDQRENRIAAERYARGRALDCFTFEGAFALHMARGAEQVLAVDISETSIERARYNATINGASNIDFIAANVFDYLRELEHAGRRFDAINLDPPAFAKNRASLEGGARGYKEINLRAMKLLNPGGTLITSSCSYHLSEEAFLNLLADAAADLGRTAQILEKRMQSRDHPVLLSMPETYYLKCLILRVN
jgi:23S rRNA (cytosine1962-C5)-methyltransferase